MDFDFVIIGAGPAGEAAAFKARERGASVAVLEALAGLGVRLVAARVDAERAYTEADLRGALGLVLGSEAEGLHSAWDDPRVEPVRIPMRGAADSLNVSVAAAVLLYEALRQRSVG